MRGAHWPTENEAKRVIPPSDIAGHNSFEVPVGARRVLNLSDHCWGLSNLVQPSGLVTVIPKRLLQLPVTLAQDAALTSRLSVKKEEANKHTDWRSRRTS